MLVTHHRTTWVAFLFGVFVCSSAMAIEGPGYRIVEQDGDYELRDYSAYLVAETRVQADFIDAGNVAFGRLFRYISGNNATQSKIEMTAPVTQSRGEKIAMTTPVKQVADGGDFLVGFVVPAKYNRASVPRPLDPSVYIREVPAQLVASWRYSGRWTESLFREQERLLRARCAHDGLLVVGEPVVARYNPPFMPAFLRRNEVLIPVRRAEPTAPH